MLVQTVVLSRTNRCGGPRRRVNYKTPRGRPVLPDGHHHQILGDDVAPDLPCFDGEEHLFLADVDPGGIYVAVEGQGPARAPAERFAGEPSVGDEAGSTRWNDAPTRSLPPL